jgi:hypothetical protein
MNPKLFKQWREEAYYEWLTERRGGLAAALASLAEDVKENGPLVDWARDTRIPQILKEIKELDNELEALGTTEEVT